MSDKAFEELHQRYKNIRADEAGMTRALHERGDGSDHDLTALLSAVKSVLVVNGYLIEDDN